MKSNIYLPGAKSTHKHILRPCYRFSKREVRHVDIEPTEQLTHRHHQAKDVHNLHKQPEFLEEIGERRSGRFGEIMLQKFRLSNGQQTLL